MAEAAFNDSGVKSKAKYWNHYRTTRTLPHQARTIIKVLLSIQRLQWKQRDWLIMQVQNALHQKYVVSPRPFCPAAPFNLSSNPTRQRIICRSDLLQRSSDGPDDELDSALSLELRQKVDPQYLVKAAKRLDVVWSVSARKVQLWNLLRNKVHSISHSMISLEISSTGLQRQCVSLNKVELSSEAGREP